MKREFKFNLGDKVIDKITGFVGTISGAAFYITGCNQYSVLPRVEKSNKAVDNRWFDEGRLKIYGEPLKESVESKVKGCDQNPPS